MGPAQVSEAGGEKIPCPFSGYGGISHLANSHEGPVCFCLIIQSLFATIEKGKAFSQLVSDFPSLG